MLLLQRSLNNCVAEHGMRMYEHGFNVAMGVLRNGVNNNIARFKLLSLLYLKVIILGSRNRVHHSRHHITLEGEASLHVFRIVLARFESMFILRHDR
jgi:hypothetical protein